MAINKATLAKEVDGVTEFIYPKTSADMVEYDENQSVAEKIASMEESIPDSIPKKTSDLTNDSGFIKNTVSDLVNYYKKSETYTQAEINNLVGQIPKFSIQVVSTLPTTGISATTVYLVKENDDTGNLYTEYIYVNSKWEILGSQKVDLTGYAKTADIPTKTSQLTNDSNFATTNDLNTAISNLQAGIPTKLSQFTNDPGFITKTVTDLVNYYDKTTIDGKFTSLSSELANCLSKNQGTINVGKIFVVGADGNITLTDMPSGNDNAIGYIDENNNIILSGLTDGTYVIMYENTDGTYADIATYVVGGLVQYSITTNLTECTSISGNATIMTFDETTTLKFIADSGFLLPNTITVTGAMYTWDSSSGTLILSEPTEDIIITIIASKNGYTNIIDTVGYTDGIRLSSSDGVTEKSATGYTLTGMITIPVGATLRTNGVNFTNASYSQAYIYYYDKDTDAFISAYKDSLGTIGGQSSTVVTNDGNGNLTIVNNTNTSIKIRLCGYGSGAGLIITINEEITE